MNVKFVACGKYKAKQQYIPDIKTRLYLHKIINISITDLDFFSHRQSIDLIMAIWYKNSAQHKKIFLEVRS